MITAILWVSEFLGLLKYTSYLGHPKFWIFAVYNCRYDHVKPKRTSPAVSKATTQNGMKLTPPPLKTIDSPSSGMVSLKKLIKGEEDPETPKTPRPPDKDWVQASEFVPGQLFQCMTGQYFCFVFKRKNV